MNPRKLLGLVLLITLIGCQSATTTPAPTLTAETTVSPGSTLLHNADASLDALLGIEKEDVAEVCGCLDVGEGLGDVVCD